MSNTLVNPCLTDIGVKPYRCFPMKWLAIPSIHTHYYINLKLSSTTNSISIISHVVLSEQLISYLKWNIYCRAIIEGMPQTIIKLSLKNCKYLRKRWFLVTQYCYFKYRALLTISLPIPLYFCYHAISKIKLTFTRKRRRKDNTLYKTLDENRLDFL